MQARRRGNPNAFQLRASLHDQFARVRLGAIEAEHCETSRRLPSAEREMATSRKGRIILGCAVPQQLIDNENVAPLPITQNVRSALVSQGATECSTTKFLRYRRIDRVLRCNWFGPNWVFRLRSWNSPHSRSGDHSCCR